MENKNILEEKEFYRELLIDSIKSHENSNKEWKKTIRFVVISMCITIFLTVTIPMCLLFKYYFANAYNDEAIQESNTNTNINTNINKDE